MAHEPEARTGLHHPSKLSPQHDRHMFAVTLGWSHKKTKKQVMVVTVGCVSCKTFKEKPRNCSH